MTILNAPAPPHPATSTRPVPWRRLAWVSWRQYRFSAAGAAVFLGVVAAYLLIMGLRIRTGYASVGSCQLTTNHMSRTCEIALMLFGGYHVWGETTAAFMLAVPVLIGVFSGAPILGRELEVGTYRFAWTQGVGRTRWALARLALPAVTVTAAAAALSQLFGWFYYPFFAFPADSAFAPQYFELTGIALAAWTLAAFAIGALAGVLIRKVVPAIAAAMAAWAGLLLVTILYLRPHYEAPLTVHGSGGAPGRSPWLIHQWWTGPNGRTITSEHKIIQLINRPQRGYTQWTTYQPEARYWHFQFIEGGWLLLLSLLLIAASIWLIRRRAA
jgi:ABC-2 family transporter protein